MKIDSINTERFLSRIRELGQVGRDEDGRLNRLAGSDNDKLGRDRFVSWAKEAGFEVVVDQIGNIFAILSTGSSLIEPPLMLGSHIDTVIDAGIYDGSYGVLAGLEVIETFKDEGFKPKRPIVVAAFTNEEGVRYTPDMMGSLVFARGLSAKDALAVTGTDGTRLGAELDRIGYAGTFEPGFLRPTAYLELHIEQGPVLDLESIPIGAVENLQGISWQQVTISGVANHAGTTPMPMRRDAGYAAARVITFLNDYANNSNAPTVATVGTIRLEPDAINVIPSCAVFTVDMRDPNESRLRAFEEALTCYLEELAVKEGVSIATQRLARFEPVTFDKRIVALIEDVAAKRGLKSRRLTSGAGHDAQMISRIAPTAMIFVPSREGISHNPLEFTPDEDLIAGANVLLDVVQKLASEARS